MRSNGVKFFGRMALLLILFMGLLLNNLPDGYHLAGFLILSAFSGYGLAALEDDLGLGSWVSNDS